MATRKDGHDNRAVPEEGASVASRRDFLKTAVAVSALPIVACAAAGPASATAPPRTLPIYKAIFDEQFPGSRAFGDQARKLGLPTQGIRADVTALWFNDLHGRWQISPVAIAGLTASSALFCLERLAWDHGMRVVFHAEHRYLSKDAIQHVVLNGDGLLRSEELEIAGANWTHRIAELVARYPSQRPLRARVTPAGLARAADDNSMTLVSWVIAPVNKT